MGNHSTPPIFAAQYRVSNTNDHHQSIRAFRRLRFTLDGRRYRVDHRTAKKTTGGKTRVLQHIFSESSTLIEVKVKCAAATTL